MSPRGILVLFVALSLAHLGWECFLILLNLRHARRARGEVPRYFRLLWSRRHATPPDQHYALCLSYTRERSRIALVAGIVTTALSLAAVLSGLLGRLWLWLERLIPGTLAAGVAYALAVALAFRLAMLPLGAWSHFDVERRFGFNRMGVGLWLADVAKGLFLSGILLGLVCGVLLWLMGGAGRAWWVAASGAVILFQLAATVLYPRIIAPLFNRFTPLPEGALKQCIQELAQRLGYSIRGIYVMDAGRRSRHTNAYFTGLGKAKRVVLYDTLLERLGPEEAAAVLAHEIGHDRLGHLWKGLLLSAAGTAVGLWVLSLLADYAPLYQAFGVPRPSPAAALVIFWLWAGPFTFLLQPLGSLWSRRNEHAADRYAHDALGASAPMVSALFLLAEDNLSNPVPHPLYSFCHYTHPTLAERVSTLEALDRPCGSPPIRRAASAAPPATPGGPAPR